MNDDQQPNAEDRHEMTNPWPLEPQPQGGTPDVSEPVPENIAATQSQSVPVQPVSSVPAPDAQSIAPVYAQPIAPTAPVTENPGQTLGIVGIVLGVLMIWPAGLPVSIISMIKSSKANASKLLGIIGVILNSLALLASGFVILMILIALPALQDAARRAETTSSSVSSSTETITLGTNYTPASGSVYFSVPVYSGWSTTAVDQEGVKKLTKDDNTAIFMTYQGTLSSLTGTDKQMTETAMGEYLTQLEVSEVTGSESTISVECVSDGKLLQFETKQVAGTSDGKSIKGVVAVRMYEGHELAIVYLVTAADFSLSEWTSMVSKLQLSDLDTSYGAN